MKTGYFERKAIEASDRRLRERAEFSEDEVNPVHITSMSLTSFGNLTRSALKKTFRSHGVIFLTQRGNGYGMVSPISFEYLLQVSAALKDTRLFTVVKEAEA